MKNAFGKELYDIKEIAIDKNIKQTIHNLFLPVLIYLEIPTQKSKDIITRCLQAASNYSTLEEYEEQAHQILEEEKVTQKIPNKLLARASLMYSQIEQYLLPGNVLDYGCGDGQVAELIEKKKKHRVTSTDVYEHCHIKEAALKFKLFSQGAKAPFADEEFDNILALTVFHHSDDPLSSIRDVCRVTKKGGRALVIESVYGVNGEELPAEEREKAKSYLILTAEEQRKVNIFFDHFYNRVLHYCKESHSKVNVPFNFNTPSNWKKIFAQCSLKQEALVHLGLDQPTVPEYHTLHVLRKN